MDHIEKTDAMTEVDFDRVTAMFVKLGCKFELLDVGTDLQPVYSSPETVNLNIVQSPKSG